MDSPPPFAEYPRPNSGGGNGFYSPRGPGVYFDTIGEAYQIFKQDWGTWVAAVIVVALIQAALSTTTSIITAGVAPARFTGFEDIFVGLPVRLVVGFFNGTFTAILHAGLITMGVHKLRGSYIDVSKLFDPFKDFGNVLGASALNQIIIFVSVLCCIIPYFYIAPLIFLAPVLAHLQKQPPAAAIGICYDSLKSHWLGIIGLFIVFFLLIVGGVLLCFVGLLVTIPLISIITAIHYRAFFESAPPPAVSSIY